MPQSRQPPKQSAVNLSALETELLAEVALGFRPITYPAQSAIPQ